LFNNSTGQTNTAVGGFALYNTTAGNNTSLGYQAGNSITTGTNNTVIGYDADASSATVSNEITLGNSSVNSLRIPGLQSGASSGDVLTYDGSKLALATPAGGGSLTFISSATASSSASINIALTGGYDIYELHILTARPATDGAESYLRTSTNAGSSFDSGSSDYSWTYQYAYDNAVARVDSTDTSGGPATAAQIELYQNVGNGIDEFFSAVIRIIKPSAARYTTLDFNGNCISQYGNSVTVNGMGVRRSAADVDAIQFLFSTGNITSGQFVLYGLSTS
jgi:hypothetical protein